VETHLRISRTSGSPFNVLVEAPAGHGPYPLVLWSHGYGSLAESYAPFLKTVASQGYVVAGPDFANKDFATHPGDLSLTIDRLSSPGALATRVDVNHIAVAGHSLGGLDVLGIAYNTCCRDRRITAAMTFEGALLDFPNGRYTWPPVPLLVVIGTADPLDPQATGTDVTEHFPHDAYLLTVAGGDHGGGISPEDVGYTSVQATVRDFLAAYLYNDTAALDDLRAHPTRAHTRLTSR
jgi:dienelactone hydrolase